MTFNLFLRLRATLQGPVRDWFHTTSEWPEVEMEEIQDGANRSRILRPHNLELAHQFLTVENHRVSST